MVLLNDMAAVWRLCLSFGLLLISSTGAIPLASNTTTMTFLSRPSPDLPPGTISITTKATPTALLPVSSSPLRTHSPTTNISKSASKSFSVSTPINAILLTTQSTVSWPSNASQLSLSNKSTNIPPASPSTQPKSWISHTPTPKNLTQTESQTSTPLTTHHQVFVPDQRRDGPLSNVSAVTHKENPDSSATRSDDFTGPVVMPVVGHMKEVSLKQRQTTISSLTQVGASTVVEDDKQDVTSLKSAQNRLEELSNSNSSNVSNVSSSGYLSNVTSEPSNRSLSDRSRDTHIVSNVTTYLTAADKRNFSIASELHHLIQLTRPYRDLSDERQSIVTRLPDNVSSMNSSMPSITLVAPTTTVSDHNSPADYQADVYDVFTVDYVTSTSEKSASVGNSSSNLDLPSLRKKFLFQFTNVTNTTTSALPNTAPSSHSTRMAKKTSTHRSTLPAFDPSSEEDPVSFAASSIDNSTSDLIASTISYTTSLEEITAPILLSRNITSVPNVTTVNATSATRISANVSSRAINKEQMQFPGITLKVSHVLIPKQKRSKYSYNIQNMKIELPKTESLNKAPPSVPKTSKNSNCTRFPVLVVTAADAESKEKVNLTEERYDCEFSSQIQSSTQQKEPVDRIRTYYGGYVFRYTIPKVSNVSNSTGQLLTEVAKTTDMTTAEDGEDYYPSYGEYLETANGSSNSGTIDDAIFPDPIVRNEKIVNPRTEAYRVPLTESTIIDSDLHDRDVIDSVMYIYFGGASRGLHGAGSQFAFQIIIVGAVIALVAQFLTLASSIRRIKTHQGEEPTIILLNVEIALTLTNLIFILGVQSPGNHTLCRITAVLLYYLHLVTVLWFLLSSLHCVQSVIRIEKPFKLYIFCICGWILPLILALLSYLFNERSFETSSYCWVSPLRGVLFSYILPVIFLCSVCIVTTVYGLGRVTDVAEELDDTYSHRKLLRISAVSLPLFSIIWFTGMISLENSSSLLFSMIYLISNTVLNWLLFGCWLPTEASQWKDMDEDYYDDDEDFDDEPVLVKRRFDDQPLLSELYEYGAQGQLYNLRIEPISIISAP